MTELTLDQALQKGVEAHKAGKAQEADRYYTAILKANPKHPDANHNMGVLAVGVGKVEAALPFFKTALETNPNIAQYWLSYIDALIKLDQITDAKTVLDQAKSKGVQGDGFDQIEKSLMGLEKNSEVNSTQKSKEPPLDQQQALVNLFMQGQFEKALNDTSQLLKEFSGSVTLYNILGAANQRLGKLEEAIEAYNKALVIKPDYADAYRNTTECLKIYSSKIKRPHNLFITDSKIKKLSESLIMSTSSTDIINNIAQGLSYINDGSFEYKTPLSQIFRQNYEDLNCKRHLKIFSKSDIIPEFCFRCFKVQVEVKTFIDLVKVTSLFYKYDFKESLTTKTFIEIRPNIPGNYKGIIFCKSLDQAKEAKNLLDINLEKVFAKKPISMIKRGCSEYSLRFPDYGKISERSGDMMKFPQEWELLERQFDQNELIKPHETLQPSLPEFCLSDFYIIQKWIDYAKGLEDQSIKVFNDRPIIYEDIYRLAQNRTVD